MRSLRIDSSLDARIQRAAEIEGSSVSEFIRAAAAERADRALASRPVDRLADVIGVIDSGGGRARNTGQAFSDLLASKRPNS
ncbi:MAG: DUF1778 domain-containing protein [Actinobacteria bacterium]|nr:DUF1778 domain-containing protein [Actinomycetota bacterium]